MEKQQINDVAGFFASKGGMHDSRVESLTVSIDTKTLSLKLDDANSNFVGLPEYAGEQPASLTFVDVQNCRIAFAMTEQYLSVDEITVDPIARLSGAGFQVNIKFWLFGNITFSCSNVSVEAAKLL